MEDELSLHPPLLDAVELPDESSAIVVTVVMSPDVGPAELDVTGSDVPEPDVGSPAPVDESSSESAPTSLVPALGLKQAEAAQTARMAEVRVMMAECCPLSDVAQARICAADSVDEPALQAGSAPSTRVWLRH